MNESGTNNKAFWICPNPKCEMIYLNPPIKCSNCGHVNKSRLENVILDNLIVEKRDSKTGRKLKSDLGFSVGLFN